MSPVTSRVPATHLLARTRRLEAAPDLLAVAGQSGFLWERDGWGLAGRGTALRISLPTGMRDAERVAATLASIDGDDEVCVPGSGPVAIGALPFEPCAPASLVIPRIAVGRSADGTAWVTTVSSDGDGVVLEAVPPPSTLPEPDAFEVRAAPPHAQWCSLVERAVADVGAGLLDKVVVARQVLVEANRPIRAAAVVGRLRALFPSCTVFMVDGFVGASPELLVTRTGDEVTSHPLAGTCARGRGAAEEIAAADLLASDKNRREHAVVVDAIAARLRPLCEALDVPNQPAVVGLPDVLHLGTLIAGRLHEPAPTALELAALLHPTPAVAGTPTAAALAWLARHEDLRRGRYAGPVGWVDGAGDGAFALGIRSAELTGSTARLFAGAGVVAGSSAAEELEESKLKLHALLAAVVRP